MSDMSRISYGPGLTSFLLSLLVGLAVWNRMPDASRSAGVTDPVRPSEFRVSGEQLHASAEELLAAINPALLSNAYFPDYVKDKLRWLMNERRAGRLDIRFFRDTAAYALPPDVVMASMREGGKAVIFLSKPRLAANLLNTGGLMPPFNARQRNDFAVSVVHEIVHMQNPAAKPEDPVEHAHEERRVWRDVTLQVVRPLRLINQPLHPRFFEVDDAFRGCRDVLPCPRVDSLIRLRM